MHCTIVFVSHDLEEAVKLGNTITIMEGGRIVQTGTPEDIVLRPANAYVADFVAHLNPLSVLTADRRDGGGRRPRRSEARSLAPDAPLKEALPLFAASDAPVWVVQDGATVGQDHLARGLRPAGPRGGRGAGRRVAAAPPRRAGRGAPWRRGRCAALAGGRERSQP